jgi:hypothetical protein
MAIPFAPNTAGPGAGVNADDATRSVREAVVKFAPVGPDSGISADDATRPYREAINKFATNSGPGTGNPNDYSYVRRLRLKSQ